MSSFFSNSNIFGGQGSQPPPDQGTGSHRGTSQLPQSTSEIQPQVHSSPPSLDHLDTPPVSTVITTSFSSTQSPGVEFELAELRKQVQQLKAEQQQSDMRLLEQAQTLQALQEGSVDASREGSLSFARQGGSSSYPFSTLPLTSSFHVTPPRPPPSQTEQSSLSPLSADAIVPQSRELCAYCLSPTHSVDDCPSRIQAIREARSRDLLLEARSHPRSEVHHGSFRVSTSANPISSHLPSFPFQGPPQVPFSTHAPVPSPIAYPPAISYPGFLGSAPLFSTGYPQPPVTPLYSPISIHPGVVRPSPMARERPALGYGTGTADTSGHAVYQSVDSNGYGNSVGAPFNGDGNGHASGSNGEATNLFLMQMIRDLEKKVSESSKKTFKEELFKTKALPNWDGKDANKWINEVEGAWARASIMGLDESEFLKDVGELLRTNAYTYKWFKRLECKTVSAFAEAFRASYSMGDVEVLASIEICKFKDGTSLDTHYTEFDKLLRQLSCDFQGFLGKRGTADQYKRSFPSWVQSRIGKLPEGISIQQVHNMVKVHLPQWKQEKDTLDAAEKYVRSQTKDTGGGQNSQPRDRNPGSGSKPKQLDGWGNPSEQNNSNTLRGGSRPGNSGGRPVPGPDHVCYICLGTDHFANRCAYIKEYKEAGGQQGNGTKAASETRLRDIANGGARPPLPKSVDQKNFLEAVGNERVVDSFLQTHTQHSCNSYVKQLATSSVVAEQGDEEEEKVQNIEMLRENLKDISASLEFLLKENAEDEEDQDSQEAEEEIGDGNEEQELEEEDEEVSEEDEDPAALLQVVKKLYKESKTPSDITPQQQSLSGPTKKFPTRSSVLKEKQQASGSKRPSVTQVPPTQEQMADMLDTLTDQQQRDLAAAVRRKLRKPRVVRRYNFEGLGKVGYTKEFGDFIPWAKQTQVKVSLHDLLQMKEFKSRLMAGYLRRNRPTKTSGQLRAIRSEQNRERLQDLSKKVADIAQVLSADKKAKISVDLPKAKEVTFGKETPMQGLQVTPERERTSQDWTPVKEKAFSQWKMFQEQCIPPDQKLTPKQYACYIRDSGSGFEVDLATPINTSLFADVCTEQELRELDGRQQIRKESFNEVKKSSVASGHDVHMLHALQRQAWWDQLNLFLQKQDKYTYTSMAPQSDGTVLVNGAAKQPLEIYQEAVEYLSRLDDSSQATPSLTQAVPAEASNEYLVSSLPSDTSQTLLRSRVSDWKGHIYVPVFVDGRLIKAIFDPGAQLSNLTTSFVRRRGLNSHVDPAVKQKFQNADDSITESPGVLHNVVLEIPPLAVVVTHLSVSPSENFDMLVGLDICRHYRIIMDVEREAFSFKLEGRTSIHRPRASVAMIPRPGSEGGPPLDCTIREFHLWYSSWVREQQCTVVQGFPLREDFIQSGVTRIQPPITGFQSASSITDLPRTESPEQIMDDAASFLFAGENGGNNTERPH